MEANGQLLWFGILVSIRVWVFGWRVLRLRQSCNLQLATCACSRSPHFGRPKVSFAVRSPADIPIAAHPTPRAIGVRSSHACDLGVVSPGSVRWWVCVLCVESEPAVRTRAWVHWCRPEGCRRWAGSGRHVQSCNRLVVPSPNFWRGSGGGHVAFGVRARVLCVCLGRVWHSVRGACRRLGRHPGSRTPLVRSVPSLSCMRSQLLGSRSRVSVSRSLRDEGKTRPHARDTRRAAVGDGGRCIIVPAAACLVFGGLAQRPRRFHRRAGRYW